VALSADGDTLAVGAMLESSSATGIDGDQTNDATPQSGAVYVFTRSGGLWSQQAYMKASNTGVDDRFGYGIALSSDGNTLAVGAGGESSNVKGINGNQADDSARSGATYRFSRSGTMWTQQAYVKASNTPRAGLVFGFGFSVALSANGGTLAVGAYGESSKATGINGDQSDDSSPSAGAVYLY
jgi:hypothetical protein